jgi:hypothetical protein
VAGTLSVEGELPKLGELPKEGLQQDLEVLDPLVVLGLLEVLVLGLEGLIMVEVAVPVLS